MAEPSTRITVTEFLSTRLDEDEADACRATPGPWWGYAQGWRDKDGEPIIQAPNHEIDATWDDIEHVAKWNPARVLAECAAKRRIVKEIETTRRLAETFPGGSGRLSLVHGLDAVLRLLALPYADHPDYLEAWRP